jgi:hypothetical protein
MWKEVKATDLKVGDKVKVTGSFEGNSFDNAEGVVVGIRGTSFSIEFKGEGVRDKENLHGGIGGKAHSCWNFARNTTFCTFWKDEPVYYTIFNKEEARHLVGKPVKRSDDGIIWTEPEILENIEPDGSEYPFETDEDCYRFIKGLSEEEQKRIKEEQELVKILETLTTPDVIKTIKELVFK